MIRRDAYDDRNAAKRSFHVRPCRIEIALPRIFASEGVGGFKCGANLPRRCETTLVVVIASNPSGPRVTPNPLSPRPPNGNRGSAVGTIKSLTQTDPTDNSAANLLAAFELPNTDAANR